MRVVHGQGLRAAFLRLLRAVSLSPRWTPTPISVAKDDKTREAMREATVPADVRALLKDLSLSAFGFDLCHKLGVAAVSDIALLTDADLTKALPAMRVAERRRLLAAVRPPDAGKGQCGAA